ncbi:MAG: GNAT family N-acetyltransferase [Oscillospiraceae bacterium]|nr:GNAT family N-acetyltransferase [Oscillospiraceae bacterium]
MLSVDLCENNDKVKRLDERVIEHFGVAEKLYSYATLTREINSKTTAEIMNEICGDCSWYSVSKCRERIVRNSMKMRLATLNDVKILSKMYEDFFAFHADLQPTYYNAAEEKGKYPEFIINSENDDAIIAEVDGNIAGFCHVLEDKTSPYDCIVQYKFAICMDLYVFPDYRKKGVGSALINAAKEWAKNRNLSFVELKVLVENKSAIRLYEREGFNKVMSTMRLKL